MFRFLALTGLMLSSQFSSSQSSFDYPETRRVDHVDIYHGTEVPDPYRWLEEDVRESDEAADWVERQNKVTFAYLESLPNRERIHKRLTELWDYERKSAPWRAGERYYFYGNDGLQNQSVLYVLGNFDAPPQVIIDPNAWSPDGTVALTGTVFSDDGRYLAYGVAEAGSDWQHYRVMNVETRELLPDKLEWMKYGDVAWTKDNEGFYYTHFEEPAPGAKFQDLTFNQRVFYHKLGDEQSEDKLVYERPDHPDWGFGVDVSDDGRWLIITTWVSTDDRYRVFIKDREEDGEVRHLVGEFDHEYSYVGNDGARFYFKTDRDAPMGRLIALDVSAPGQIAEVIGEQPGPLRQVNLVGGKFIAEYLDDAKSRVSIHDKAGEKIADVPLPGLGSASGFSGKPDHTETFYSFSSFATPPSAYRYNLVTGEQERLWSDAADVDSDEYVVEQVFYQSKDGTRVPMFITHKRGIERDGANPTLLFGYGGFNIAETPGFSAARIAWLEQGGVFALPNLRGGGEYGEAWHKAGTKDQKQNVFDDFIAAAEYLIAEKYASPQTFVIEGRSNGGLLVGAAMTQRPDLFAVALPAVGVMDMLRFHKFTAGRFWTDDYGSADVAEEFPALRAYSPYHNLEPGTRYPATLITTADTDDRVVPGHSFKFAAALQHAQVKDGPPVLIRIETKAGHGAGKPTDKLIAERADLYAFALHHAKSSD